MLKNKLCNIKMGIFGMLSALFILLVLFYTTTTPLAHANGKNIKVLSHYKSNGPPTGGNYSCPTREGAISTIPMQGTLIYGEHRKDTLKGKGDFTSCVYVMQDQTMQFVNREVFTGWIKGYGNGSIELEITGNISAPDPTTGNQTNNGQWKVIPETGTGDLKKIKSGFGKEKSTVTATYDTTGVFTGFFSNKK